MATQPSPPSSSESPAAPGEPAAGKGPGLNVLLAAVVAIVVVAGVALLVAAGAGKKSSPNVAPASAPVLSKYRGSLASPAVAEPPLSLRSYQGKPVNIAQYRGKAVFVTFIFTHCPDTCPVIASNLGVAQNLMGRAKAAHVQLVAVSVDPRGDTPRTVAAFLRRRGVAGRMQYLIGSAHELSRAWKAWGVGSERDSANPELVSHSALVYGITASGKLTTLYPANFTPQEIVHDAPLLAAS